jgi:hypothetical protein
MILQKNALIFLNLLVFLFITQIGFAQLPEKPSLASLRLR